MTVFLRFLLLLFLLISFSGAVYADMGAVVQSGVSLSEPGQNAIIAFNGSKEILILQTNWKADRSTAILRFIPFPSPPEVGESENAFSNLQALLNRVDIYYVHGHYRGSGALTTDASVRIVSRTAIKNHDLTVLEVHNPEDFKGFVTKYFASRSLSAPSFSNEQQTVVRQYYGKGFRYFVLDRVDLRAEEVKAPALKFTFSTKKLYYPLLTSNTIGGRGAIQLFIMTKSGWIEDPSSQTLPYTEVDRKAPRWRRSIPARLSAGDAGRVDTGLGEMLGSTPVFFALKYDGVLSFKGDIHQSLVSAEEDLKTYDPNPLFKAILADNTVEIRKLLRDPKAKFRDARMWTPLQFASAKGKTSVVRLLSEMGQPFSGEHNMDFRYSPDSPLELAISNGHEETAKTLLNLYDIRPEVIERAAELAEKLGMTQMLDLLKSSGNKKGAGSGRE